MYQDGYKSRDKSGPSCTIWPRWKMGEVDRLPYKSLLQIVDVPIQYMFRYTNSDERCKCSAGEELSIAEKIPLKGTRRREKKRASA